MTDTFTVIARDWHGQRRRRLVLAADAVDAVRAYREDFPHDDVVAVMADL